jgi:hypothetical protein
MQTVTRFEFDEVRHRRSDKMSARRFRMLSHIDVGLHNAPGMVNVIAIQTRAMILALADHFEPAGRGIVTFTTGGNRGLGDFVSTSQEKRLLPA